MGGDNPHGRCDTTCRVASRRVAGAIGRCGANDQADAMTQGDVTQLEESLRGIPGTSVVAKARACEFDPSASALVAPAAAHEGPIVEAARFRPSQDLTGAALPWPSTRGQWKTAAAGRQLLAPRRRCRQGRGADVARDGTPSACVGLERDHDPTKDSRGRTYLTSVTVLLVSSDRPVRATELWS